MVQLFPTRSASATGNRRNIRRWTPALLALLLPLLAAGPVRAEELPAQCRLGEGQVALSQPLPRVSARLAGGESVTIVAIGSSSTAGEGASSPATTYPARLEALLRQRYPHQAIVVHNRGVRGEEEPQMVARFERDVFALNPDLVIWQVGANAVLHDENLDQFWRVLDDGIRRLQHSGAEVVLMDGQFAPRLLSRPNLIPIEAGLPEVARRHRVALFPRYDIMRGWIDRQQFTLEQMLRPDLTHLSDASYDCLARLLARGLADNHTFSSAETPSSFLWWLNR